MEIKTFIHKTLAFSVDEQTKNVAVLLEFIAHTHISKFRGISVPTRGMTTRPVAIGGRANVQGHLETISLIEPGATHFGQLPAWTQVACAHLWVGLKATTGQHHTCRAKLYRGTLFQSIHTFDMAVFVDQGHGAGTVEHLDLGLFARRIQILDQTRSTPIDLNG